MTTRRNPAEMARRHGAKVRHLYRHALKGYSTNLTAGQAARLRSDPGVATVVAEQTFRIRDHLADRLRDRLGDRQRPVGAGIEVANMSTYLGGGHNTFSGTSMASPHVAGAAGLYKAGNAGAVVQGAGRTAPA